MAPVDPEKGDTKITLSTRRVLLVDDEPVVLDFLRMVLEAGDLYVDTAANILGAFDEVQKHKPDPVLLDASIPGGGVEICKMIRANMQTKFTQIILFSVAADPLIYKSVWGVPADGYMRITPNTFAIRSKIRLMLNLVEVPYPSLPMESQPAEALALREGANAESSPADRPRAP